MRWRFWVFVSAASVAGALLAEIGAGLSAPPAQPEVSATAEQPALSVPEGARLPGNCDKGIVLFCADPAWPD